MASVRSVLASLEGTDRGIRFEVVGKLGRIRERRRVSGEVVYFLDFRPYGRVWSHRGIPMRHRDTAARLLEQIRGKVAEDRSLEEVLAQYLPTDAKPNLVRAWLERWLEVKRRETEAGDRSPTYLRELKRYTRRDGHFSFFSTYSIHEIDYGLLEDWSLWLADRGLAAKTRRNVLGAFRSFMGWLRRRGQIRDVPEFPWPRVDEHEPHVLSAETQEAILAAIPEDCLGIFYAMGLMGLRPGEARALEISDWQDGWLIIDKAVKGGASTAPIRGTKTGKAKRLPVPDTLQHWIENYVDSKDRLLGGLLFPNPRTGRVWNYWTLREVWMKACGSVGVSISLYEGTKHTFATDAIRRGVQERHLQAFLGHADVRSTRRYARLSEHALVDVLRPGFVAGLSLAKKRREKPFINSDLVASPAGFEPALPA